MAASKFLEAARKRAEKAAAAAPAETSQGEATVESQETQPGNPPPDPHCFDIDHVIIS